MSATTYSPSGDRYPMEEAERRGNFDDSFWVFFPFLLLASLARLGVRHPYVVVLGAATAALWAYTGPLWVVAAWLAFAGVLTAWRGRFPASFARRVLAPMLSVVRGVYYRRHWRAAMFEAGLDDGCRMTRWVPRLLAVRAAVHTDALWVRPLAGQSVERWQAAAPRLAAFFGTGPIRVDQPDESGRFRLLMPRTPEDADKVRGLMVRESPAVELVAAEPLAVSTTTAPLAADPFPRVRAAIEAGRHQVATTGRHAATRGTK